MVNARYPTHQFHSSFVGDASSMTDASDGRLRRGAPGFHRANLAMFAAGLATFSLLYAVQPILPAFSLSFGVSPSHASLVLSICTATMAVALIVIGSLSEAWGRRSVMMASLAVASALGLLCTLSASLHQLLVFRGLEGIALAGIPAVAMAWLSEEIAPQSLGLAMGLYISGNAVGGMAGRIGASLLTGMASWRVGMGAIGLFSLVATIAFWRTLPVSRNFQPRPLAWSALRESLWTNLREPGLLMLYGIGALLMGSFVTLFDYICYRLIAPPYHLSQTLVSWIFLLYITGVFSSTWMGQLADRWGRRRVLWIGVATMLAGTLLSVASGLAWILAGMAIATFGFFGSHSVASSWVGRRAHTARAQASALYLLFYYFGSSVTSSAAGLVWERYAWTGVVAVIAAMLLVCLWIAFRLAAVPPLAAPKTAVVQNLNPERSPVGA